MFSKIRAFLLLVVLVKLSICKQDEICVTVTKIGIGYFNEKYIESLDIKFTDHNSTTKLLSISFNLKQDLPATLPMNASCKVGIFPKIPYNTEVCAAMNKVHTENPDIKKAMDDRNLSMCPFKKGNYSIAHASLCRFPKSLVPDQYNKWAGLVYGNNITINAVITASNTILYNGTVHASINKC